MVHAASQRLSSETDAILDLLTGCIRTSLSLLWANMADATLQFPTSWTTQNVALRELVSVSCVLLL